MYMHMTHMYIRVHTEIQKTYYMYDCSAKIVKKIANISPYKVCIIAQIVYHDDGKNKQGSFFCHHRSSSYDL